jgi:hypothetical protein
MRLPEPTAILVNNNLPLFELRWTFEVRRRFQMS